MTTPPLDSGPWSVSDLVLGQEGQGILWRNHNVDIPLAPLNAVNRHEPVSLYYQVRSQDDSPATRTTVALYRVENGIASDTASLEVGFAEPLHAGINEVAPTLDVSRLDKGNYRLELRVSDERGMLLSKRAVVLTLN